MQVFGVEWWPVAGVLTVIGLVLTVLLWRRRGPGAGMRMLGVSFLPGAIVLIGLQDVLKELWKSLARFVTNILFAPQIWVGLGMAAAGVVCLIIGNRLTVRKLKGGATAADTSGGTATAPERAVDLDGRRQAEAGGGEEPEGADRPRGHGGHRRDPQAARDHVGAGAGRRRVPAPAAAGTRRRHRRSG